MSMVAQKALNRMQSSKLQDEVVFDPYPLINQTIKEINEEWKPGPLKWMKANRPHEWGEILAIEGKINSMALGGNIQGLRGALSKYQGLILAMVKEFKAIKEEKGQGMFNFAERPKSPGTG